MSGTRTGTRQRILDIAGELFAERGYAGTALADIAERLGATKAALYYHFRSKAAILDALVAEPIAAYSRLAEAASGATMSPADLLAAVIDTSVNARSLLDVLGNDPSARALLDARPAHPSADQINATLVAALAGPDPSAATLIRAHAAYTVAKLGTLNLLAARGRLDEAERAELLAAALRALNA